MSNASYERLWRRVEEDLCKVLEDDKAIIAEDVLEDREDAKNRVSRNYIRYIVCANKLNVCYDQIVHPDKRKTVKTLLEATLARLLEVKQELVGMLSSDYSYLDKNLLELKLTRYDMDIKVPLFYRRDRAEELKEFASEIDRILEENAISISSQSGGGNEGEITEERNGMPTESVENDKQEHSLSGEAGEEEEQGKRKKESPGNKKQEEEGVKEKKFKRPSLFKKVELSEEEKERIAVIRMLQVHERARVARLRVQQMLERQKLKLDIAWGRYVPPPVDKLEKAARSIVKFWRGYLARHKTWCRENRVREFIGELRPSWRPHEYEDLAKALEDRRLVKQKVNADFAETSVKVVENNLKRKEENILEDIGDELRWYIENWFRVVGELPDFPDPDKILAPQQLLGIPKGVPKDFAQQHFTLVPSSYPGIPPHFLGGSALIVAGFWIDPELYKLAYTAAKVERLKKPGKEKLTKEQIKEMKEEAKEKAMAEKEEKKRIMEEKLKLGYVPKETKIIEQMKANLDESKKMWHGMDDILLNPNQTHRQDLITSELTTQQHFKLRDIIDEQMRLDLVDLQQALDRDRKKKKKGKKKKKKKIGKRGPKDPTKDRSTKSLFEELVRNGIIKKYGEANIDSFYGDFSWNNEEYSVHPFYQDPPPGLGDVRQVVKEYCIIPLGSSVVHKAAPLVRSVLLFGQKECGHRYLVDAICNEAGAVLFDLTPTNTVGKYPGAKGKKMLVHLVNKMSRVLQPSVVFIGDAEKMFYRKVPKQEKATNPKLLNKVLYKMVKEVKPDDQVLFVGTCVEPWLAAGGSLAKCYDKIVLIPRPDYGTSSRYWFESLMTYHGLDRDFTYSTLVTCIPGYSLPTIDRIIQKVMTPRRIIALKYRPLHPQELLDEALEEECVTDELHEKMINWCNTFYPLAKGKSEKMAAEAEVRAKLAAIEAKKKLKK